jgi:hypothetical protein
MRAGCNHDRTMTGDARVIEEPVEWLPEEVNRAVHGGYQALEACLGCGSWRRVAWRGHVREFGDWLPPALIGGRGPADGR